MPNFFTPVLPSTAGLALGSPSLPWTIYATNIITAPANGNVVKVVPWSAAPILDASASLSVEITLLGDVLSSSFVAAAGPGSIQLVIFYIAQDAIGGRRWTWPTNFHGVQNVDNLNLAMAPSQVMVQQVYWSGTRAVGIAAAPAIFYP